MYYQEIPAHSIEPDWIIGAGKEVLCVEYIVLADMGIISLHCHILFDPEYKVILVLNNLQMVSVAFGGHPSETETIQ